MEAAVELVRQSWVNRPLSKLEKQRVLVAWEGTEGTWGPKNIGSLTVEPSK